MCDGVMYLDLSAGAAGDMFLGALLDLGAPEERLHEVLGEMSVSAEISIEDSYKMGIKGKKVTIDAPNQDHHERTFFDIKEFLEESSLNAGVVESSLRAFRALAEVEGEIHGKSIDQLHFHEVGSVDSIVDVVGTFNLLEHFDPSLIYASEVNLGRGGFIECAHGKISNPAPATVRLLEGIPTYSSIKGEETVTPTGAVLLGEIVDEFDRYPSMSMVDVGNGLGRKELSVPNILNIFHEKATSNVGETEYLEGDRVVKIETNIDDDNPEIVAYATEKLLSAGALDVFQTPVYMKKRRSGTQIVVICELSKLEVVQKILFEETSTFGYRYFELERRKLPREIKEVETKFGNIKVKVGYYDGKKKVSPEFESCREASERHGVSLREVYRETNRAFFSSRNEENNS